MKVSLTQGKFAIVDAADGFRVRLYKWTACHSGRSWWYAYNRKLGYMHRWLLDTPKGREVLHRNNDGLDNRRKNLLLCNRAEAMYKQRPQKGCTSQYKGVFRRKSGRFYAYCFPDGGDHRKQHLGSFGNEEDAARAYDTAVRELYGELARTNF